MATDGRSTGEKRVALEYWRQHFGNCWQEGLDTGQATRWRGMLGYWPVRQRRRQGGRSKHQRQPFIYTGTWTGSLTWHPLEVVAVGFDMFAERAGVSVAFVAAGQPAAVGFLHLVGAHMFETVAGVGVGFVATFKWAEVWPLPYLTKHKMESMSDIYV